MLEATTVPTEQQALPKLILSTRETLFVKSIQSLKHNQIRAFF